VNEQPVSIITLSIYDAILYHDFFNEQKLLPKRIPLIARTKKTERDDLPLFLKKAINKQTAEITNIIIPSTIPIVFLLLSSNLITNEIKRDTIKVVIKPIEL